MKGEATLVSSTPLLNGFNELTFESPLHAYLKPGHAVLLDDTLSGYAMNTSAGFSLIVSSNRLEELDKRKSTIPVRIQGSPLPEPTQDGFTLLTADCESLSACLFYLKCYRKQFNGLVLIGSSGTFPFAPCPSRVLINGIPTYVTGALPLLEDWGIANRLASEIEIPGVFHGTLNELETIWQSHNRPQSLQKVAISCSLSTTIKDGQDLIHN